MYLETTHGYYDRYAFWDVKSIRPMNVNVAYWKNLGYSRKDLEDPEKNIEAGIKILKGIQERMPDANFDAIATVYQSLPKEKVTEYGARAERILNDRLWEK